MVDHRVSEEAVAALAEVAASVVLVVEASAEAVPAGAGRTGLLFCSGIIGIV